MWAPKLFIFLIWIMACVSELRGRCRLSAAIAIIYSYLGPFSITTTLMRTQECLHLCQNTSGKPFTASNFVVRCAPHLLILAMSVRHKKKSSCDFVRVWKEEMPAWAFFNFVRSFLCQHADVRCNVKNAANNQFATAEHTLSPCVYTITKKPCLDLAQQNDSCFFPKSAALQLEHD